MINRNFQYRNSLPGQSCLQLLFGLSANLKTKAEKIIQEKERNRVYFIKLVGGCRFAYAFIVGCGPGGGRGGIKH